MNLRKINFKHILVIAVIFLMAGFFYKKSPSVSSDTKIGSVTKGDLIQRVTIAGVVVPQRRTVIVAPFNGYVKKIFVKVGDIVKAGDPLVSVVQTLQSSEDVFPMRAPFPGKVVAIQKTEGENVKADDTKEFILKIDDMSHVFVEANAAEIDRVKIAIDQEAIVKASAILSRAYKGVIRNLDLSAKETERWSRSSQVEFPIRLEVVDPDDQLYSGMSVVMDIVTAKKEKVLLLRHEFIRKDADKYYVILQSGKRKDIEVGLQNEEAFEITSGVSEGEKIRQVDFSSIISE
ncbi:MAG: HlyD family efflux transporter periplasmic adaptor subunit [Bdellovibrionota bacterium]